MLRFESLGIGPYAGSVPEVLRQHPGSLWQSQYPTFCEVGAGVGAGAGAGGAGVGPGWHTWQAVVGGLGQLLVWQTVSLLGSWSSQIGMFGCGGSVDGFHPSGHVGMVSVGEQKNAPVKDQVSSIHAVQGHVGLRLGAAGWRGGLGGAGVAAWSMTWKHPVGGPHRGGQVGFEGGQVLLWSVPPH